MKTNRKLFLSGFNEEIPLIMHITSRIVDRQYLLGDEEREVFVEMMRMYEEFCGIKVLSYCVMSNHFHLLLEIPPQMDVIELSDDEFLALKENKYNQLVYVGHGGPGALFISDVLADNIVTGKSQWGGVNISKLDTSGFLGRPFADFGVRLISCCSAVSQEGQGSVALEFSKHFKTLVEGSGGPVVFHGGSGGLPLLGSGKNGEPTVRSIHTVLGGGSGLTNNIKYMGGWTTFSNGKEN